MKHSHHHGRCVLLLILFLSEVVRHSSVQATKVMEAIAEQENSAMTRLRNVQHKRLSFSKPVSDVSLNQDDISGTVQTMFEDASDMDDNYTTLRHRNPKSVKATVSAVAKKRYLKKNSGGKVDKKDDGGKQNKKDGGGKGDKKDSGKKSKKGTTTQNNMDRRSGFFDSSTNEQQQELSIQSGDPSSTLGPLSQPDNNIFDPERSSGFTSNQFNTIPSTPEPSPNPTTAEPTIRPTFPPTTRQPTEVPTVNTPVPTDSSTFDATMEFTTLPPSFSPTPTAA